MSAITIYVPRDAAALAVGADAVAEAITQQARDRALKVDLIRNGSRGLLWLEPLVEVATPAGRVAYGPVHAEDVAGLFDAGWLTEGAANAPACEPPASTPSNELIRHTPANQPLDTPRTKPASATHPLCHGLTEAIPYLARQERLTFARVGVIDPLSIDDYQVHGGLAGLRRALSMTPEQIVEEITASGLRGRGGAAFPTGIKWKTALCAPATQKYVVCNADEGDSGTFADRLLMEGDPYTLIEGMTIAALAVGATQGYLYVRAEYPHAIATLNDAIERANAAGWLGENILGSQRAFTLSVRKGAGAYICGEETALLQSLEGKRGTVRVKPPLPAIEGLFGKPTVINNVISLAATPAILAHGANWYRNYGMGRSRGTLPFQLAGNIARGGLVEKAFGVTLRELLIDFGAGSATGRALRAVQVGGPLGAYLPESQWDAPLDYEAYTQISAMIGHGGLVAFDDTVDMARMARYAMEFCAIESCGKCTPCRIGSTRGQETLDGILAHRVIQDEHQNQGKSQAQDRAPSQSNIQDQTQAQRIHLLRDLCDTMLGGSLCALGGMAPYPVLSALNHFPEDFGISATHDTHA